MSLEFSTRQIAGITVFDIKGRMVASAEGQVLHATLMRVCDEGQRWIVVNCADVHSVDSSGLGDLVASHAAIIRRGGVLRLLHPSPRLVELLQLTRLDGLLEAFDNEAQALASFNAMNNLRTQQKLEKYLGTHD